MDQNNITNAALKIVAGLVLVVLLWLLYQMIVVIPQKEIAAEQAAAAADRAAAAAEIERREQQLEACMQEAWDTYSLNWDRHCEARGKEPDCSLAMVTSANLDQDYKDAQDRCVTLYK